MNLSLEGITKQLKSAKLRVTQSRLAVAEVLLNHQGDYLSSEEIFHLIESKKGISCDQVSVYRILTKYAELGIVRKSDFHNEAARYTLCTTCEGAHSHDHSHEHEHYFKCTNCLSIESFQDCFISKKEKELLKKGYRNLSHHIEITGLCPACS